MRITLIYVGSTSESFFVAACEEYEKRIKAYATFQSICVKEERIADEDSDTAVKRALTAEAQRISAAIPKGAYTVALCVEGKRLSSEGLAHRIEQLAAAGVSSLALIIGSSHGISSELKAKCNLLLSMSEMTFPHMLARVMLTEQIYRAFTIIDGKKYHK